MKRTILAFALLLLLSSISFAEEAGSPDEGFMIFGDKNFAAEKTEESKWIFKTGLEYIQYTSNLPEYSGKFESVSAGTKADILGFGLGIGREFYFTNGFSSTFLISAVYQKSLDKSIGKAAEDIDYDLSNVRDAQYVYAYEASLSLNYLLDYKTVDVQPFIDIAGGMGYAEIEKEYIKKKEAPSDSANTTEDYDVKTKENFLFTRLGLGVNFIHFKGFMSYFKVSSMIVQVTDKETIGSSNLSGTTAVVDYDGKEKNLDETEIITTAQLGLGYYF